MIGSSWFYPNSWGNSEFILPPLGKIALTCQNSYFCHFSPYVLLVDYTFDIFIAACQDGNIKLTRFFSLHVVDWTCQRGFFFSIATFIKKKSLYVRVSSLHHWQVWQTHALFQKDVVGIYCEARFCICACGHATRPAPPPPTPPKKTPNRSMWVKHASPKQSNAAPRSSFSIRGVTFFCNLFAIAA